MRRGDTPASLTTPVVLTTAATASSPVGRYMISAGGAASLDYTITFRSGTFNQDRCEQNETSRDGCDRASAKDFHEIRAVFTRGVA